LRQFRKFVGGARARANSAVNKNSGGIKQQTQAPTRLGQSMPIRNLKAEAEVENQMSETVAVQQVEGAISCGEFSETDGKHWWARLGFLCPHCTKRHRVQVEGLGKLPKTFPTVCQRGGQTVEVVPYR
jgi:hypothetical protein